MPAMEVIQPVTNTTLNHEQWHILDGNFQKG